MSLIIQPNSVTKAYETNFKHSERSDRYHHVTTKTIGDIFQSQGFDLVKYGESKTKSLENRAHSKHLALFRYRDDSLNIGDSRPQIIIQNDGLGLRSLRINLGLYRLVCANGLVIGNDLFKIALKHDKNIESNLETAIPKLLSQTPVLNETYKQFKGLILDESSQRDLAQSAFEIQTKNSSFKVLSVDLNQYLKPRRWADADQDAWSVFNRIQENVFRKQIYVVTEDQLGRADRKALKRVRETSQRAFEINSELWSETTKLLNIGA